MNNVTKSDVIQRTKDLIVHRNDTLTLSIIEVSFELNLLHYLLKIHRQLISKKPEIY